MSQLSDAETKASAGLREWGSAASEIWWWNRQCDAMVSSGQRVVVRKGMRRLQALLRCLASEDRESTEQQFRAAIGRDSPFELTFTLVSRGLRRLYRLRALPFKATSDSPTQWLLHLLDLDAWNDGQWAAEMQRLGQVAGGLAHECNNQLTVISGYCHLLLAQLAAEDQRRESVIAIREANQRLTAWTRQLLSISGRSTVQPESVDLVAWLRQRETTWQTLVPGQAIRLEIAAESAIISVDVRQLEEILGKLLVAMARWEPLESPLELRLVQEWRMEKDRPGGRWLGWQLVHPQARVSAEQMRQRFEPYYCDPGQRTKGSLDLAACYGAIVHSGGSIQCEAIDPVGTRLRVLWPAANRE